jgi:hypothetical protein
MIHVFDNKGLLALVFDEVETQIPGEIPQSTEKNRPKSTYIRKYSTLNLQ